ncbi:MAG: adenylate/guanylate cyclase domain-containing protein [Rhodospirillales bacterium]
MAKNINFEVQIMQGGRWTIHARFPGSQRDQAIEEGKQLDQSKIGGGVRVIRDVYDSETGTSSEYTVYKSSAPGSVVTGGKDFASSGGGGGDSAGYDDDDDEDLPDDDSFIDDPDERRRIKKLRKERDKDGRGQTSITGLIVKLLLITLASTVFAIAAVFGSNYLIEGANVFGVRMRGAALENFLILLFFIVFITTAILLSSQAFKGKKLKEKTAKSRPAPKPAAAKSGRPAAAKSHGHAAPPVKDEASGGKVSVDGDSMDAFRADAAKGGGDASSLDDLAADLASELSAGQDTGDDEVSPDAEPASEAEQTADTEDTKDADIGDDMPGNDGTPTALSPQEEKQKSYMMDFMKEGLEGAGQQSQSMSNFDKFGVSLFVAGATEALCQTQELSEKARAKIMADGVQTMGFKRSHASSFAEKYEEYLVQDPTYMQMFQAGRNAMNTYFTDPSHAGKHLQSALTEWNKPKRKEAEAGPVTVLFTDIAGSTAMTQALGDAGAQQVVRGHNRVVREALSQWSGKEVKHTGDGIMASFAKTSDSLDAAIQMQRECEIFRQQNPELPLRLKIGINAGEPIAEDNDLFGSTVQMSARIVDKAQADEIFVSEIVRGICAGKTYKFKNRGTYPMKGFETDPTLYEVVWREDE